MKRSVLLSLLLLAAATLASAQTTAPPAGKKPPVAPTAKPAPPTATAEERLDALTNNMVQVLGLTPAQAEKVRVINAASMRNGETARQRYKDNPTKFHNILEDITLARLEQLKDVLTPAQFNRYQQKREEKLGVPTVRGYQGTPPPGMGGRRGGDE